MTYTLGKIAADFNAVLSLKVAVGDTTATISTATDDDGVALPAGKYFFTIDRNSSSKEYIYCSLSGTSLTSIQSVSRQGALTTGFARSHRAKTATVEITDFAIIKKMLDLLDGTTDLNASVPLKYDANPTFTTGSNQIPTVKYVDDIAISGSPVSTTTTLGISKSSFAPADPLNPIHVESTDPKMLTTDLRAAANGIGTPSASNRYETQFDTSNGSTYTATTISFTASTKTIADSANGFITAGFKQGTQIVVSGTTSNNGTYTIMSVAAGAIVVAENLVNESAGGSDTITTVTASKVYRLKDNGKMDATMLEGNLPALNGSALTGIGDRFAISNNILNTAWTNGIINFFSAGTGVIGAAVPGRRIGDVIITPTGNGVGTNTIQITGVGSSETFGYALGKSIAIKHKFINANTTRNNGFGLAVTSAALYANETDITAGTVRFLIKAGVVWACNSNGSAATATNVDAGITDTNNNTYGILYTPTAIYFYINNVLVATHTANIPVTGTPIWGFGISGNGSDSYYFGDLVFSIEN